MERSRSWQARKTPAARLLKDGGDHMLVALIVAVLLVLALLVIAQAISLPKTERVPVPVRVEGQRVRRR